MQPWTVYAILSTIFAGLTGVIAKQGLAGVSADVGMTVRTSFVFLFTALFAAFAVPSGDWALLKPYNWIWLGASATMTTLSWIFYYRAIKLGELSVVALIDKGSVIVAILCAFLIFHEAITPAKMIGAALILAGIFVVARG